jgi:hypothetical protein
MGVVIPPTSPWIFYQDTDANGKTIRASVDFTGTWAPSTVLNSGTVFRDPGCVFTKIAIGALSQDGSPAAGTKIVTVPDGTTNITKGQLNANGLVTVADIQGAAQLTALR